MYVYSQVSTYWLIISFYPAANARRYVLKYPSYKIISVRQWQVQAVQWRFLTAHSRPTVVPGVWYQTAIAFDGWVMAECLGRSTQQWTSKLPQTVDPGFAPSIHNMKQFAYNWYLPCCRRMWTFSRVSSTHTHTHTHIYIYIHVYIYVYMDPFVSRKWMQLSVSSWRLLITSA